MTSQSRHVVTGVVLPLIIAAFGFFDLYQRPEFGRVHKVDAFQLVVCGMCLGIALPAFIDFVREPRAKGSLPFSATRTHSQGRSSFMPSPASNADASDRDLSLRVATNATTRYETLAGAGGPQPGDTVAIHAVALAGRLQAARVAVFYPLIGPLSAGGPQGFAMLGTRVVVSAAGPWTDEVMATAGMKGPRRLSPTRGSHVVVPASRVPVKHSVVIKHAKDTRMMFAIPWGNARSSEPRIFLMESLPTLRPSRAKKSSISSRVQTITFRTRSSRPTTSSARGRACVRC